MSDLTGFVDTDFTVAAIVERDGRFLMVEERAHGQVVFNQPSGHLEAGETLEQSVIREMREETTRNFRPRELVGMYQWRHPDTARHYLRVVFAGNCSRRRTDRQLDAVIIANHWMSRNEIAARSSQLRSPMVLRCIDDYLDGVRLPPGAVAALRPRVRNLDNITRLAAVL